MYFVSVALLLLILPAASIAVEASLYPRGLGLIFLIGKWLVFWAVGIRLFMAGTRQIVQPRFTAEEIFHAHDPSSLPIVREVGFGNLSIGALGIWSILRPGWVLPAAIVGGLYYGLAGIGHSLQTSRNAKENFAMLSDEFVFLVLLGFVLKSLT
jgi:hypothetical protein